MAKKQKVVIKEVSFMKANDGKLIEVIYNPETGFGTEFIEYDPKRDELSQYKQIKHTENTIFVPIKTSVIDKGVVLLPTNAEGYKSDKELLRKIENFIYKYLDTTPFFTKLSSYYVFLSWVYDCFTVLPYLRVIGDPGSGKSRFLQVVGMLLYKPMFASGATTASPIFRLIEKVGGSLILDEADFRFSGMWEEIIKILNSGYQKGFPVLRTEGNIKRDVRSYNVYSPKILATRQPFKDPALESRMITQEMTGELRSDIPIVMPSEAWEEALVIRNKLLMWRFKNYNKVKLPDQNVISNIEPRLKQILLPLMGVIKDKSVLSDLMTFATSYQQQMIADRGMERHVEILEAIVSLANEGTELQIKNIADKLNEDIDTESGERKITPHKVGQINRNYLRLPTKRIHGRYQIEWNEVKIKRLCTRYGIDPNFTKNSDVEDLDGIEEAFNNSTQDKSPKSTKSPSK